MGDFYSSLFENLYGLDLSDYIWGTLSPVQRCQFVYEFWHGYANFNIGIRNCLLFCFG